MISSSPYLLRVAGTGVVLCCLFLAAQAPSPTPERWWKGNLHTHTLWSDGDDFPDMIASWYRDQGYHFLALSDHNVLGQGERWMPARELRRRAGVDPLVRYQQRFGSSWVQTRGSASDGSLEVRLKPLDEVRALVEERGRFLMLPAEEVTGAAADGRSLHMNVTNVTELLTFQIGPTVRDAMTRNLAEAERSAQRTGRPNLVHVNHPNYKWGVTAEDLAAVTTERYFEVWNGVDNDNDPGEGVRPSTDEIWDIANTLRIARYGAAPLLGLATDDSHDYHGNKPRAMPGRAWVMVRAAHLTPESLVRAFAQGDFYSTTGVTLDEVKYDRNERRLSLRIRGQAGERFRTQFIGTRRGANLQGKPRSTEFETTLDYSAPGRPPMGQVLAEVTGENPTYKLAGDELYVRAVVTSSAKPKVESSEHPFQRAWTQPVQP